MVQWIRKHNSISHLEQVMVILRSTMLIWEGCGHYASNLLQTKEKGNKHSLKRMTLILFPKPTIY